MGTDLVLKTGTKIIKEAADFVLGMGTKMVLDLRTKITMVRAQIRPGWTLVFTSLVLHLIPMGCIPLF